MAKREKAEILPTMKVTNDGKETTIDFRECQVTVKQIRDSNTKHGDKVIAVVEDDAGNVFSVFMNAVSQNLWIDAHGEDDDVWIGKLADLKKEVHEHFKNEMIVMHPVQ